MREHAKLYPYYYEKYRDFFKPSSKNKQGICLNNRPDNSLFLTARVENGKNGKGRYNTKDSHFDKVGSVRRSFYIPDNTMVQVLCKEEMLTLQKCLRPGKLFVASKYTVVWNNRYIYKGDAITGLKKGAIVTLVKFGEVQKKGFWNKVGRISLKPFKWLWKISKELLKPIVKGLRRSKIRHWHVSIVKDDGTVEKKIFPAKETDLEHVGKNDFNKVRDGSDKWKTFEMLGNVNKVNLTDLMAGNRVIQDKDVPAYGELYEHCTPGRCKKRLSVYDCNYCLEQLAATSR